MFTSLDRLRNAGASIQSARSQVENLGDEREELWESLREDGLTDEERREKLDEIETLDERIDRLEDNIIVQATALTAAIAAYTSAVEAARGEGFSEPMESELIRELGRLAR